MKKHLFIIPLLLAVISCMEEQKPLPNGILKEEEMVKILIDIHLLESATAVKNLPRDSSLYFYSLYEKNLLQKHGITDSIYKVNLNYYSSHPEIMKNLYEKVVDSLSWREEKKMMDK